MKTKAKNFNREISHNAVEVILASTVLSSSLKKNQGM